MSSSKFIRLCEAAEERAVTTKFFGDRVRITSGPLQGDYRVVKPGPITGAQL